MLKRGKSFLQSVVQIGTPFTFVGVLALLRRIALSEASAVGGLRTQQRVNGWLWSNTGCRHLDLRSSQMSSTSGLGGFLRLQVATLLS